MANNPDRQKVRLVHDEFIPLHNKKRQHVSKTSGEVISRRQFVKQATREVYIAPPTKKQRHQLRPKKTISGGDIGAGPRGGFYNKPGGNKSTHKLSDYYDKLDRYIDRVNKFNKSMGYEPIGRQEARTSPDFKMHYKAYQNSKDRKKGGARHQALLWFGYLEEGDDYY